MKIAYADFWGGFNPTNNFFTHFLKKYRENVSVVNMDEADTLIYSVFGSSHQNFKGKKIFYTGENRRPNFNECDVSLTFDFDLYNGKNIRLPLWFMYIDWFNKGSYENPSGLVPLDTIGSNKFTKQKKDKFCCIVVNHLSNNRDTMKNLLDSYKPVDGAGNPFGNWFYGEDKKYAFIAPYKFTICFENTIYPGYHTEKLFHAKLAGCIPIYNGARTVEHDFNKNCFINLQDYNNIEDFAEKVKEIDQNDSLYNQYFNEPLFNTPPDIDHFYNQVKNLL